MAMTADSIRNKAFMTVKSGYDPDMVETFLGSVADQFEALLAKTEESDKKVAELEARINEYKEDEEAIKNALVISQKESNKIINDAKAQARDMIESAKTEQIRLSEQSASECERIIREHKENCAKLIKENTDATEQKIIQIRSKYIEEKKAYDNLRREVTMFKAQLLPLYKQQLSLIMQIPDSAPEETPAPAPAPEPIEEKVEEVVEEQPVEETVDEAAEEAAKAAEAEKEHIDKILNTGSFEPVIPKQNLQDLKFGKNN